MSRIAYINGRYVPKSHAQVAVEDRGYLFSDGVYDVLPVTATLSSLTLVDTSTGRRVPVSSSG